MLVYRKTLVPLRLFHKNLRNLQDFIGKWFTSSPSPLFWQKMARTGTHDSLLNITDSSVVIHKLRQDKGGQTLRCSGEHFCGL